MKKKEILETIKSLANNQGFYSGLYSMLISNDEDAKEYLEMLENKNFKDSVDLILYFEG